MRVLDLFAGLGGWSAPFLERGHDVTTVDINPGFAPTICADALEVGPAELPGPFDIILASPPCEVLSVGGRFTHWLPGYQAGDDAAETAIALVRWTYLVIERWAPPFYLVENPRGMLRKLYLLPYEERTVWYCHLGERQAKPTDLWGGFPPTLELPRSCHNVKPWHDAGCCCRDHEEAPRGSPTGTQGKGTAAERAIIPHQLAERVRVAAERDLGAGLRAAEFSGRLFS